MKNTNKILFLVTCLSFSTILSSCDSSNTLLLLNWGEYINEDLISSFEEETGAIVKLSTADSNELFYSKVKSKTTAYDLVIPSDYMVQRMHDENLLQSIQFDLLTNYNSANFLPGVKGIELEMTKQFEDYTSYQVPYFYGTFGIMYNKRKAGLEEAVLENGWKTLFENDKTPIGTRRGMYNAPRFSYSAALAYQNLNFNIASKENLTLAKQALSQVKYYEWGTDQLKKDIQNGVLDVAFVYTGDFLDMIYEDMQNILETTNTIPPLDTFNYGIYIPSNTIAFMDSFVIPNNARHVELAHKFIDYFLQTEIAYENASIIGYCTPYLSAYQKIIEGASSEDIYNKRWGEAVQKYYPILEGEQSYIGIPLNNFSQDFLTDIINMVNDVKSN